VNLRIIALVLIVALLLTSLAPMAAQNDTPCEDGFRLFEHELLATDPVCIPEQPERIVALESFEVLLSLDYPPVAAVTSFLENHVINFPTLAEEVDDIEGLGTLRTPNAEVLIAANPDLIIGSRQRLEPFYDQLSTIAPTVLYDFAHSGLWKEVTAMLADITNQQDEYEAQLALYESRVQEFREALGDTELSVSVVRILPTGVRLYTQDSFSGEVIESVGLTRPESQQYTNDEMLDEFGQPTFYGISRENLQLADGDFIFIWTTGYTPEVAADAKERLQALRDDPLWSTLGAVRDNDIHEVGGYWIGSSFIAAHYMLDDLFEYVLDTEPTIPNPFVRTDATDES
jgi:iron complex transport system substrate-binding protein